MKYFVVAYFVKQVIVLIPVFKSVDEACDYCHMLFDKNKKIKICQVFSIGSRLVESKAVLHNIRNAKFKTPKSADDDLPF